MEINHAKTTIAKRFTLISGRIYLSDEIILLIIKLYGYLKYKINTNKLIF